MKDLMVELGERSYPIRVAPLEHLGRTMAAVLPVGRCVLVGDERVTELYGEAARRALEGEGWAVEQAWFPEGEAHKTLDTWRGLVEELLAMGTDRGTPLIALGGGVTGDVVGFAGATLFRGVPVVQVPTTLLAMVDSSVGGKTGVNTEQGKNLVGAFHQPRLVHVALETLTTLEPAELRSGLGEVVKHAVLGDPALFAWLEEEGGRLLDGDREALRRVVLDCCRIKAGVVAQDEREAGLRRVLNAGHTVAHALERVLGYGALRHGEAVAIGLVAECAVGFARGQGEPGLADRIAALNASLGLPVRAPGADISALMEAATMDKKVRHGTLHMAYPTAVGQVTLQAVSPRLLRRAMSAAVEGPEEG